MPSGGAGLMRFYQDESMGIKVSPKVTILLSVLIIVVVILAHLGYLDIILG
jgi:preprotein translocase subunit Sec61beta